jgi:hypothetical protein
MITLLSLCTLDVKIIPSLRQKLALVSLEIGGIKETDQREIRL